MWLASENRSVAPTGPCLFRGHLSPPASLAYTSGAWNDELYDVVEMGLVLRSGERVDSDAAGRSSLRVGVGSRKADQRF